MEEVTRDDMKRQLQNRKQHSELEMIKYESLIKQKVEETSMEEVYTDSLNQPSKKRERKSRKKRLEYASESKNSVLSNQMSESKIEYDCIDDIEPI